MRHRQWKCRDFKFTFDDRPLLMGVVNVTPDSFSDGGQFFDATSAIEHAYHLSQEGADIIDIGGESSRPGAPTVSIEEEIRRIKPVIEELAGKGNIPVSIDTVKYEVAQEAVNLGACVINDISGLCREPRLAKLAADSKSGLVLMHMRGTPANMQELTDYDDILAELQHFFNDQIDNTIRQGVELDQIAIDPGIGFSKTADQNCLLIKHLEQTRILDRPILIGVSRKSFIGKITGKEVHERLLGTAAAVSYSIMNGADILRVHDVKEIRDVVSVLQAIQLETIGQPWKKT